MIHSGEIPWRLRTPDGPAKVKQFLGDRLKAAKLTKLKLGDPTERLGERVDPVNRHFQRRLLLTSRELQSSGTFSSVDGPLRISRSHLPNPKTVTSYLPEGYRPLFSCARDMDVCWVRGALRLGSIQSSCLSLNPQVPNLWEFAMGGTLFPWCLVQSDEREPSTRLIEGPVRPQEPRMMSTR